MRPFSQNDILQQVKLSSQFPTIVEAIATRLIIEQHAKDLRLSINTDELQKAADCFRLKHDLVTVDQTVSWLKKHGLSLDELEKQMSFTVLSTKLAEHLFAPQIEPHFAEHRLDYVQVVLYEIVLQNADLALELFYAIHEQETTFTEVARHYIQEEELRRKGGYRGILKRADLKPELSAAVFATSTPNLLKPIVVGKNSHLVFVEEVIQPQLNGVLKSQILSELFAAWIHKQLSQQDWLQLLAKITSYMHIEKTE